MMELPKLARNKSKKETYNGNFPANEFDEGPVLQVLPLSPIDEFFSRKDTIMNHLETKYNEEYVSHISEQNEQHEKSSNEEEDEEKAAQEAQDAFQKHQLLESVIANKNTLRKESQMFDSAYSSQKLNNNNNSINNTNSKQKLFSTSLSRTIKRRSTTGGTFTSSLASNSLAFDKSTQEMYFKADLDNNNKEQDIVKALQGGGQENAINNQVLKHSNTVSSSEESEDEEEGQAKDKKSDKESAKQTAKHDEENQQRRLEFKKQKKEQKKKMNKGKPYEIFFREDQFLRFFVGSILFFHLLGPLSLPIMKIFDKNYYIVSRNIRLIGFHRQTVYNYMHFTSIFILTVLMICDDNVRKQFTRGFLGYYWLSVGICITRALRFAYMHPSRVRLYETQILSDRELDKDRIIKDWAAQEVDFVEEELLNSVARLEIETSSFYIGFMTPLEEERNNRLVRQENQPVQYIEDGKELMFGKTKTTCIHTIPFGVNILKELVFEFNNRLCCVTDTVHKSSIFWTVLANLCCLVIGIKYWMRRGEVQPPQIVFLTLQMLLGIPLRYLLYFYNRLYVQDLERKLFLMNQLTQMIAPKKVENDEINKKLYPTLNLVCPVSLKSWSQMRRVVLDYGQKEMNVLLIFIGGFMIYMFIASIALIVSIYNDYQAAKEGKDVDNDYYIQMMIDFIFCSWVWVRGIILGAKINTSTPQQRSQLEQNRYIFNDILNNFKLYYHLIEHKKRMFSSPLYQAIMEYFYFKNTNYYNKMDHVIEHCENVTEALQTHIRELEINEINKPYKVLGIAMTRQLAIEIATGLISVFTSLFVSYYTQNVNIGIN